MPFLVQVLNCLAHPSLGMINHFEAGLCYTQDISTMLSFVWYHPVFYYNSEGKIH